MKTVDSIIGLQVAVTLVAGALVWAMTNDSHAAMSALWGGSISFASAFAFARAMRVRAGSPPSELMRAQYRAQAFKFAVTLVGFGVIFALDKNIVPLPLFLTYGATILVYWVALLRFQDER